MPVRDRATFRFVEIIFLPDKLCTASLGSVAKTSTEDISEILYRGSFDAGYYHGLSFIISLW